MPPKSLSSSVRSALHLLGPPLRSYCGSESAKAALQVASLLFWVKPCLWQLSPPSTLPNMPAILAFFEVVSHLWFVLIVLNHLLNLSSVLLADWPLHQPGGGVSLNGDPETNCAI